MRADRVERSSLVAFLGVGLVACCFSLKDKGYDAYFDLDYCVDRVERLSLFAFSRRSRAIALSLKGREGDVAYFAVKWLANLTCWECILIPVNFSTAVLFPFRVVHACSRRNIRWRQSLVFVILKGWGSRAHRIPGETCFAS